MDAILLVDTPRPPRWADSGHSHGTRSRVGARQKGNGEFGGVSDPVLVVLILALIGGG
jgi:hypothetical protein